MCSLSRLPVANNHNFGQILTLLDAPVPTLLPMRAKFGGLEQTQGLHIPAKFHLNVFIVSASGGQKLQLWANFDNFGGFCIDALLPMRAKFGVLQQTHFGILCCRQLATV